MGPTDKQPALPHFEWASVPDSHRVLSRWIQECNYMQAVEGEIDSAHVSWLHAPLRAENSPFRGRFDNAILTDGAPVLTVKPTDYGFLLRRPPRCRQRPVLLACHPVAAPHLQPHSLQRLPPWWPVLDPH